MALLKIHTYPDPILREECVPVVEFDGALKQLAADMAETMYASDGIGLAAPQVGIPKAFIVLDVASPEERGKEVLSLANPSVVASEGTIEFEEGCLSLPELTVPMKRSASVTVAAQDLDGKAIEVQAEGLLAIALQHEIDHLHGRLLVDYLSPLKRPGVVRKLKKIKAGDAPEVE
jgi:peptide deformylase